MLGPASKQRKSPAPASPGAKSHTKGEPFVIESSEVYPRFGDGTLVVYDLRDPAQWTGARRDREAWGRERAEIHALDNDHIIIEYKPGGALEASA